MRGIIMGTVFIILAIVLAPFDTAAAIACLVGAALCIALIWVELS